MCSLEDKTSTSAKSDSNMIVGVTLNFIRHMNATTRGDFQHPKHVHLENPRKTSISAKPDFEKIVGLAQVYQT